MIRYKNLSNLRVFYLLPRLLISLLILYNIAICNAQVASIKINTVDVDQIEAWVESYANKEISLWQEKGRYEKTEDYKLRVTPVNRQSKINELTNFKINEIASRTVNLTLENAEFDANNEVYRLSFFGLPKIYIKVPVMSSQAEQFDRSRNRLKYLNAKYTLTPEGFALLQLTINNPTNNKYYYYDYREDYTFKSEQVRLSFKPVDISISGFDSYANEQVEIITIENDIIVDENIPDTKMNRPNAVAVVIGNKDYKHINSVDYALNDSKTIKNYLTNSMGFKEGNILYLENISKIDFEEVFGNQEFEKGRLYNMIKPGVSDVFIYYSGHGAPGINNYKGYFVPVECDPNYLEFRGYSSETFYSSLSKLPAKSITILIDACFSGENVHENISSILIKVKDPIFQIENGTLLASSRATEPSCWFNEQEHGLFTYFFLKAIQDKERSDSNSDNSLSIEEIYEYISSQTEGVPYYARRLHAKEQHPTLQGAKNAVMVEY